jgi:hypothetical protein
MRKKKALIFETRMYPHEDLKNHIPGAPLIEKVCFYKQDVECILSGRYLNTDIECVEIFFYGGDSQTITCDFDKAKLLIFGK